MTTKIPVELSSTPGITDNSNATAITIDSSENVMIGTTSTGLNTSSSEAGHNFFEHGYSVHSRSGQTVMSVNRLSDDGNIMDFRKNGTAVGSIGVEGGDSLFIQGGTSSGAGLLCHGGAAKILPVRNSTSIDATIDLGQDSRRFKDLYLSGGVVFDAVAGNATSNTLDDYEEGTWTPVLQRQDGNVAATIGTITNASYTKIGNMVNVNCFLNNISAGSSNGSSYWILYNIPYAAQVIDYTGGILAYNDTNATSVYVGDASGNAILTIGASVFTGALSGQFMFNVTFRVT